MALKGFGAESLHGCPGQSCGAASERGGLVVGSPAGGLCADPRQLFAEPPPQERGPKTLSPLQLLHCASTSRPSQSPSHPAPLHGRPTACTLHPRSSPPLSSGSGAHAGFGRSFSQHPQSTSAPSPPHTCAVSWHLICVRRTHVALQKRWRSFGT